MSLRTKCPYCQREAVLVAEALGKNVRCKGCGKTFTAQPAAKVGSDPEMRAAVKTGSTAVKAGTATATKARIRPPVHDHEDEDDSRTRTGNGAESKATLWIGLSAIGTITTLMSVLVFVLIVNRHPQPQLAHAAAPPPVKPQPVVEAPPQVAVVPPAPKEAPPVPRPVFEPAPKVPGTPASLYGTQGGDEVAPGVLAPRTFMRASADDSFYRVSAPQVLAVGNNPRASLRVEFQRVERRKFKATHLMIRFVAGGGEKLTMPVIEGDNGSLTATKDPTTGEQFPEIAECFLVRFDLSRGEPSATFLVSNIARAADVPNPTRPRDWTPGEIARFSKPAPAFASGLQDNGNPGVGVDTPSVGDWSNGLVSHRYADPQKPLLGVQYRLGSWAGEKCLGGLAPIFSQEQAIGYPAFERAKEGYAVAGAEVQIQKHIDAIKFHYRRIKADGSLDPSDAYEGQWFGVPDPAARIVTLGDTGPRVLGIFVKCGAVIGGVALVMEK
jgi:hypothetical protein